MSTKHKGGFRTIFGIVSLVVFLCAVYVLSFGPVVRLRLAGVIPSSADNALDSFYKPLDVAGSKFKPFERFVEWYMILWNPNHPDLKDAPRKAEKAKS